MLADDMIMLIDSPFEPPMVLCRNNIGKNSDDSEIWEFSIDYRKLNAIMQFLEFLIPVIY